MGLTKLLFGVNKVTIWGKQNFHESDCVLIRRDLLYAAWSPGLTVGA